ncbi:uncharacterized protein DUF4253 [Couchioplanes caeruleus]|uniref:DUF4253 domain-containing protein n=3 Tax=Couchioplanes caeruleus TaxID=56438 RepID=A0A1K0G1X1_9ACTN|nr:hypothetical protein BG844_27135 [Couchioplanes caeruleus subsp. caeruleus]ROP33520.1 uncharacterized protein DUF4253 [Couchioplanes caeruleus]
MAGLPVGHGPRGTLLVQDVPPDESLAAWRAARARVPVTGRWPVLVTDEFEPEWLRLRARPDPSAPTASELADLDQTTNTIDPWPEFTFDDDRELLKAGYVALITQGYHVDLTAEAIQRFGLPTTAGAVERWVYQRVLSDPELLHRVESDDRYVRHIEAWYAPDRVTLMLLPTDLPWMAPFWTDLYMTSDERLAGALRQWHERWGAHLVASWGTVLQLVVERPPQSREDAWTVAGQILGMASHLEMARWKLAIALPRSKQWHIHNRP